MICPRYLCLLLAVFAWACNDPAQGPEMAKPDGKNVKAAKKKVLLIGIDGCRGDVIRYADIPRMRQLMQNAVYSYDALTQPPTWSGPGWSSLLTGVWSNKHGVTDNSFSGSNYAAYPMIFKHLKAANPSMQTVSICAWAPINQHIISDADAAVNVGTDAAAKDSAVARLKNGDPDFMFVQFNEVDNAGHGFGFDTSVPQYMSAISNMDAYVGDMIDAMRARPGYADEDWMVIITTDHGGNLAGHGGNSYEEQNIFLMFHNKRFASLDIKKPVTNSTFIKFTNISQFAYTENPAINFGAMLKFTVEFRMRSAGLDGDPPFITNKDWNSGGNKGWVIFVNGQGWRFNAGDGSRRVDISSGAPDINDNKWHHIAVSVDRTGLAKLYQDGKLYNSISMTSLTTLDPGNVTKLIMADDISRTYASRYGKSVINMGDVRLWNDALDAATIATFASCDTTVTPDHPYYDNLMGWWKGTDGKGTVLKDSSPKKIDMQITGDAPWEETGMDFCLRPVPTNMPKIVDVAPRIITWFNMPVNSAWNLDGKIWFDN